MVNLASIKCEKSLKIPEGESEFVNRRTANTMAKIKGTKGQTMIYKTKDQVTRIPVKTWSELRCSGRVNSSCSTSDTSDDDFDLPSLYCMPNLHNMM